MSKQRKKTNQPWRIKMTKQAILENVLDMFLTSKQITVIEHGWNEFYNNPLQYKNSIVVDMVKLFLTELREVK